jgi:NAD(P)-dependent dehydrogenase (short-subunit alcohol dehydrogenase family)
MDTLEGLGYRDATVVVTGGSSGMGEATVRILGDFGARVHVVDLNKPSVPHADFYETDISDPAQVSATAAKLRAAGPIHSYFSCAGAPHTLGPLTCMLVNYVGARQLLEETLPAIADGGGIGIIASQAGMAWQANLAANLELLAVSDPAEARAWCEAHPEFVKDGYSTSKEMLIVYAMHEAIVLGERHIRINCTAPCPTNTAFMKPTMAALGEEFFQQYPYPVLGRMATANEQAWPLVLLNSPLNAVVSGTVLYTDQGFNGGAMTGSLDVSFLTRMVEQRLADDG